MLTGDRATSSGNSERLQHRGLNSVPGRLHRPEPDFGVDDRLRHRELNVCVRAGFAAERITE
ncbi:hypothetical protein AURDEDRAFT_161658 [Auricularia subglabra TFB-10046 SS5]|nr:hypothetical protein AURDEDRAFT_161658 [Auricularia subglabra TFB-10046 SS5]